MTTTVKNASKVKSVPAGLAIAASISMVLTFLISAVIACFLDQETITWNHAGYCIMGMLYTASYLNAKCAYRFIKRQKFIVSIMSGFLYWGLLLCLTALFFGGKYSAVWVTAGIVGAGCCSAALTDGTGPKKRRRKHTRHIVKLNKKITP